MKRCPKCHGFGVKYDPSMKAEKCLCIDCLWVNKDNIDEDKVEHPIRFQKFINAISKKE